MMQTYRAKLTALALNGLQSLESMVVYVNEYGIGESVPW
jgi:hypothetical protein